MCGSLLVCKDDAIFLIYETNIYIIWQNNSPNQMYPKSFGLAWVYPGMFPISQGIL